MPGPFHTALVYLGLTPGDDEYDAYETSDARAGADRVERSESSGSRPAAHGATAGRPVAVVADPVEETDDDDLDQPMAGAGRAVRSVPTVTAERAERGAEVTPFPTRGRVTPKPEVGRLNRITTIHPRTYNEAKTIGESFREGTPVIMNLGEMADDDAKRLVDFAAGLVFGLSGTIERVTSKVFVLSPSHVEIQSEAATAAPGKAVFNQS